MGDYLKEAYDKFFDRYKPCYIVYDNGKSVKEFTKFNEMYSWYLKYKLMSLPAQRANISYDLVWRLKEEGEDDGIE